MKIEDKISERIRKLPEKSQREVLDFIEFLLSKYGKLDEQTNVESWNKFSLDQAMRGLEKDDMPDYYVSDLKEKYGK